MELAVPPNRLNVHRFKDTAMSVPSAARTTASIRTYSVHNSCLRTFGKTDRQGCCARRRIARARVEYGAVVRRRPGRRRAGFRATLSGSVPTLAMATMSPNLDFAIRHLRAMFAMDDVGSGTDGTLAATRPGRFGASRHAMPVLRNSAMRLSPPVTLLTGRRRGAATPHKCNV